MIRKITFFILIASSVCLIGTAEISLAGTQSFTLNRTLQRISYPDYGMTPYYLNRGEFDLAGPRSGIERGVDRNGISPAAGLERADNAWRSFWKDIGFNVKRHAYGFTRKAQMTARAMQEMSRLLSILVVRAYSESSWRLFTISETAAASR